MRTALETAIQAAAPALTGVRQVFLFGSALDKPDPQDVDLLVVYDPSEIPPGEAAGLRSVLTQACAEAAIHPLDVVLLTGEEAHDTDFPARENAELVFQPGEPAPF